MRFALPMNTEACSECGTMLFDGDEVFHEDTCSQYKCPICGELIGKGECPYNDDEEHAAYREENDSSPTANHYYNSLRMRSPEYERM